MSESDDYDTRIPLPEGFDKTNALVVSSTQFETFERCARAWWFRFVRDMPQPDNKATTFGTTLHAVCERYLKADDLGYMTCRDCLGAGGVPGLTPSGAWTNVICEVCDGEGKVAVDLYPKGWADQVSPVEADLIQKLVAKAIEEGILERHPGREVEIDFLRPLVAKDGVTVFVRGTKDLQLPPDTIEDHKTTKAMKWAKSPAKLADHTQPLLYSWDLAERLREEGQEPPARFRIAHNVFVKDAEAPKVRKTWARLKGEEEDGIPIERVYERIEHLTTVALDMLDTQITYKTDQDWRKLPDPHNFAHACGAFGGCPYRPICGGRETPERYRRRLTLLQEKKDQERNMSNTFDQKLAGLKNKVPAPGTGKAPAINSGAPKAPVKPPTVPTAPKPSMAQPLAGKTTPRPLPATVKPATAPAKAAAPTPKPAPKGPTKFTILLADGETQVEHSSAEVQEMLNKGEITGAHGCKAPGGTEWKSVSDFAIFEVPAIEESAPEEAQVEESTAEQPEEAGEARVEVARPTPPWANPKCMACQGSGFNTKNNACAICDSLAGKTGQPRSFNYKLGTDGEGNVTWTLKGEEQPEGSAPIAKPAAQVTVAKAKPAPKAPERLTQEIPTEESVEEAEDLRRMLAEGDDQDGGEEQGEAPTESNLAPVKRGRGRPPKGFTLAINCAVMKCQGKVTDLTEVLRDHGQELAAASGVGDYYDLNPFERRDTICAKARQIASTFGPNFVVANGHSPDLRALVDAIRPYATWVIEGGVFVPSEMAVAATNGN